MPAPLSAFLSAGLSLLAVLGLIVLLGRLAAWQRDRKGAGSGGVDLLAREATLMLDAKRRLHLIRCANRRVLILTGGGSDVLVGWLPEDEAR